MLADRSKTSDLELDIAEWKHLETVANRESVIKAIRDRILSLERQIEATGTHRPITTETAISDASKTGSQQAIEIFAPLSNFAWDQTTEFIKSVSYDLELRWMSDARSR